MTDGAEPTQEKGRSGVQRAKRWLDKSTRVYSCYTIYDNIPSRRLLEFTWPGTERVGRFDIGGMFQGEDLQDHSFLVEVKNYGATSDQYPEFKKFLALCYVAYAQDDRRCDHLLWVTWRPFKAERWGDLTTINEIINAVVIHRERVFGTGLTEEAARAKADVQVASAVSSRLCLIVLSDLQEKLVITARHYGTIMGIIMTEKIT